MKRSLIILLVFLYFGLVLSTFTVKNNEVGVQSGQQVQHRIQLRTEGGVGRQVRYIAQDLNQAQTQTYKHLNRIDSKGSFTKLLTGIDYGTVKNLKDQIEQNQLRIQQLERLQNPLLSNIPKTFFSMDFDTSM